MEARSEAADSSSSALKSGALRTISSSLTSFAVGTSERYYREGSTSSPVIWSNATAIGHLEALTEELSRC